MELSFFRFFEWKKVKGSKQPYHIYFPQNDTNHQLKTKEDIVVKTEEFVKVKEEPSEIKDEDCEEKEKPETENGVKQECCDVKVILCTSEHICSIARYCFRSFKQL